MYDAEMVEALGRLTPAERGAYILMEKIKPPPFDAYFLREGQLLLAPAAYEVGIYGVFLGDKNNPDRVLMNESVGQNLRTKLASANEGGVAAGVAVLSSLLVVVEEGGADLKMKDVRAHTMSCCCWTRQRRRTMMGWSVMVGGVGLLLATGVVGIAVLSGSRRGGRGAASR